jgi:predicted alpha/beta-hydrolase family hydrolase
MRRNWTRRSWTYKRFTIKYRGGRKKCFSWPTFRGRLTKQLRKCIISLRMTKTGGPNIGSFVKKVQSMKMNGTAIFTMVTLLR